MEQFAGKVAVVTGGASGIGFAMAQRFAAEGMKLVLADIEEPALEAATKELSASGTDILGVVADVADHAEVVRLRDATLEHFGGVHIVCNNAGVVGYSIAKSPIEMWQWVVGVNLFGVINGCNVFLPTLTEQGDGHVVNTASLAGIQSIGLLGIYCTTKFAVVGLSESLSQELAGTGVGVSVVCPGFVNTKIGHSHRNMPPWVREAGGAVDGMLGDAVATGIPASQVADEVFDAVTKNRLYVLPHPDMVRTAWDQRTATLFGGS